MFFRKKPVVIQAVQFTGGNGKELEEFVGGALEYFVEDDGYNDGFKIKTLEGTSYTLQKDDWVIRGVKGEFYPCKPDIFEQTYEPA